MTVYDVGWIWSMDITVAYIHEIHNCNSVRKF